MTTEAARRAAIFFEHPDWFRPLFAELDRRGLDYVKLDAGRHRFDPGETESEYAVVVNRMSPSAHLRGHAHAIFYTTQYLAHLRRQGVRVINGLGAWRTEVSKALQMSLLHELRLPCPRTVVIGAARDAPAAARGLRFPVLVKPNIGGSGAGIVRYESPAALERAVSAGALDLGLDHTALVQEFLPAEHGRIVRVEILDGEFLYAIRVYSTGESFNLCPADVCRSVDGVELDRSACAADTPRNGLRAEAYDPPAEVITDVERIMRAAGIEIGGVEYLIDARSGRIHYYDINALSNFVADAPRVLGFDPFCSLADWIQRELLRVHGVARPVG